MHKLILCILFVFFVSHLPACSGGGAPSESSTQSETNADAPPPVFTDANAALEEGSKLLDSGETEKAIDALNQAVKLDPGLAEAYFKLGIAYALVEKREQAAQVVDEAPTPTVKGKKAIEKKTKSEEAFEKAAEAYKKILAANEADDAAHFNLGRAYNKLNEDEDAAKELKQAVKLNPDETEYQTELGAIMVKLAKYDEAIGPLTKALELDPENFRAQKLLDDAEAGKKRVDFAAKSAADEKRKAATANSNANANIGTAPSPQASPGPAGTPAARPKATPAKQPTP